MGHFLQGPPSADRTGATGSFATQPREGSQPGGKFTETWLVLEFCDRDCLQVCFLVVFSSSLPQSHVTADSGLFSGIG